MAYSGFKRPRICPKSALIISSAPGHHHGRKSCNHSRHIGAYANQSNGHQSSAGRAIPLGESTWLDPHPRQRHNSPEHAGHPRGSNLDGDQAPTGLISNAGYCLIYFFRWPSPPPLRDNISDGLAAFIQSLISPAEPTPKFPTNSYQLILDLTYQPML